MKRLVLLASLTSSMAEVIPDPHDSKVRIKNAVEYARNEAKYYAEKKAKELLQRIIKINYITDIEVKLIPHKDITENGKILLGFYSAVQFTIFYEKDFSDFEEEVWQDFIVDNKDLACGEYNDKDKCFIKFENDINYYELKFYEMKKNKCTLSFIREMQ